MSPLTPWTADAVLSTLRRFLLALLVLGLGGVGVELLALAHYEDSWQFAPLVLIDDQLRAEGVYPLVKPQLDSPHWDAMDYGPVVVHLFDEETRKHYALEELWGDAGEFDWQSQATA